MARILRLLRRAHGVPAPRRRDAGSTGAGVAGFGVQCGAGCGHRELRANPRGAVCVPGSVRAKGGIGDAHHD